MTEAELVEWWNNHTYFKDEIVAGFWSTKDIENVNSEQLSEFHDRGEREGKYDVKLHETIFGKCYTVTVSCT